MRGVVRLGPGARRRLTALLLTGTLAVTAASAGRLVAVHKHGPRPVAAVAVNASDTAAHPTRGDLDAVTTPTVRPPGGQPRSADPALTSEIISSGTAGTAPVRGPPGEAAA
jgi:hypothetical protein